MICAEMSDKELITFFENARSRFVDAVPHSDDEEDAERDLRRARIEMASRFVKRFGG